MYIFTLENSLQEKNSQIDLLESENQILKTSINNNNLIHILHDELSF